MERTRVTSDEARTASEGRECACEVCVRVRMCVCVLLRISVLGASTRGATRMCKSPAGVDGPVVGVRAWGPFGRKWKWQPPGQVAGGLVGNGCWRLVPGLRIATELVVIYE